MGKIRSKILNIISEEFSVPENEITEDIGPGDLTKWDSIGQLRLIMALEKQFNIQLTVDNVMSINNVRDINKVITKFVKGRERQSAVREEKVPISSVFHSVRVPSNTFWGKNSISVLKELDLDRIAVITGPSKYAEKIIEKTTSLFSEGTSLQTFQRPKGEPIEEAIIKLSSLLCKFSPRHIIAIGGGSTIDMAKLSWLLYEKPDFQLNNVDNSVINLKLRGKASFIAIPTTFGSGSEVSSAAAFTKTNDYRKSIMVSHDFIPDQVILDPLLGKSAEPKTIFSSAFDALTHAIEGYVSLVEHAMLEPVAVMAIKDIIQAMKKIISEGMSIEALETLCYASYYAGIVQNHCSVGLTHSFAHQLGHYGISHGIANALFLALVIDYNARKTDKYNILAEEINYTSASDLVAELKLILSESSIIPRKDKLEIIVSAKTTIVSGAMEDITFRTNPVIMDKREVESVFDNAMENYLNG
mgnify:FL=1